MKKNAIVQTMSALLMGAAIASSASPVFATETQTTEVTYALGSSFIVTIPKTIALDSNKTAGYTVTANGDVYGNEFVTVIPDKSFILEDANGKDDVIATVTQTKTEFLKDSENKLSDSATGVITASDLTSGNWNGVVNFYINTDYTYNIPGIYNSDNGLTKTWDELKLAGMVTESLTEDFKSTSSGTKQVTKAEMNFSGITDNFILSIPENVEYILNSNNLNDNITKLIMNNKNYIAGSFQKCLGLKYLEINNVSYIGDNSFYNCQKLEKLVLPDIVFDPIAAINGEYHGVQCIGFDAFSKCLSLKEVVIPACNTLHGFNNCTLLETVTLPDDLGTFSDAFNYCPNLSKIIFKGKEYTSKSALFDALSESRTYTTWDNSVYTGRTNCDRTTLFNNTALTE